MRAVKAASGQGAAPGHAPDATPLASRAPAAEPPSRKAAHAYHHGDLRGALILAARECLRETPAEALTLKSLAQRVGVSQPAPYRHFADREALLTAVAADGFARFAAALTAAASGPPEGRFDRACRAYLFFARENVGVYRLMFASPLLTAPHPDSALRAAAAGALDLLSKGAGAGAPDGSPAKALALWSCLHGMAMLAADGLLPGSGADPADLEASLAAELVRRFAPPSPGVRPTDQALKRDGP